MSPRGSFRGRFQPRKESVKGRGIEFEKRRGLEKRKKGWKGV